MAKLYHHDATICSFAGESFKRAADGSFEVPAAAVAELVGSHGFATKAALAKPAPQRKPEDGEHAKAHNDLAAAHVAATGALKAERDELAGQVGALKAQLIGQPALLAERDALAAKVAALEADIADLTKPAGKKKP